MLRGVVRGLDPTLPRDGTDVTDTVRRHREVGEGHKKIVHSLAFSDNGRMLASSSDDNTIGLRQISE